MSQQPPSPRDPEVPRHVAVIMDGNGRWAQARGRARTVGHRAGLRAARRIVRAAGRAGVEVLTLFAFSQENWKRPQTEVSLLMQLFVSTLSREMNSLHKNNIRVRFIGEHGDFAPDLRAEMQRAQDLTRDNDGMHLLVAVGYGGQWDIVQAARRLAERGVEITAERLEAALATEGTPPPDLLIRTGGESRISNFLLWQLAYTELYFSPILWPDFDDDAFAEALRWYAGRQRRFGRVPEAA
ncbi:polyprenyl diphosphate synthase [Sinimarinibacterium thermocellulolyticum]|uniref:Ditrans,polycis-undecaprenyl-diphosphate synthase ((2E,6E)-farnesyl-diphosphate specific) n=1 Tax=Sinimarinibacterium thermocellulolyticum TaxID=3170016 RepID=A0ABV2AAH0_9GAMM